MGDNSQLHQPQRLDGESFEDYKKRRAASHQLNKLASKGFLFHASVWHSEAVDKNGNEFLKRHHKTYVKPQEN